MPKKPPIHNEAKARPSRQVARLYDKSRVSDEIRRQYRTKAWNSTRQAVFARDGYECQHCKRVTPKLVCDHIIKAHDKPELFYDLSNLQSLCKPCHDSYKQSIERGGSGAPKIRLRGKNLINPLALEG